MLSDIQQEAAMRWAISQSITVNMNLERDAVPFIAEDFLGRGNRDQRIMQREQSRRNATRLNQELETMKRGDPAPDNLPDWAKGAANAG